MIILMVKDIFNSTVSNAKKCLTYTMSQSNSDQAPENIVGARKCSFYTIIILLGLYKLYRFFYGKDIGADQYDSQ